MCAKLFFFLDFLLAAFFPASEQFLHFCHFANEGGFETAEIPNETAKKPDETANKNQETKMWKLKRRKKWKRRKFRQPAIIIAVFRISCDNFAQVDYPGI
jgi:hypothetical protein